MIPHEILAERSDERSAPNRTHVLTCGSCRAPVPLGFSDSTECLKCQQPVPIPESLRHRRDGSAIRCGDRLFRRDRTFICDPSYSRR